MMYSGDEVKAMARGWLHPEEYYEWALEQVKRRKLSVYKTKTIKLDEARTDIEFSDVQGDALAVISIDGTVDIRLNEKENDLISLNNCREIPTGFFYRIFVTNTAQTGKSFTLYFGHAAGFRAVPIGSTKIVNAGGSDINPATEETANALTKAGQLPTELTTAGNLKQAIQETAIVVPQDLQAQLRALHASTTTALAANASWTSTSEEILNFGRITGTVFADVAGTIYVEQSPDNTNWDVVDSWSVTANTGMGFSVELVGRYVRVRYANSATAQGTFRLFSWKRAMS